MALFQRIKTPFGESIPEGEVVPLSGPRSAGDVLRQQREALGLDLSHVAAALRIKPAYLAALEEGRPDRLPGPAYAVGFVRAYGDHLGLDSEEILRRFKVESAALDAKPDLSFPMPLGERSMPGSAMLLVALILALCGYGTWYYLSTGERARPERVTEVPMALLPPTPARPRATPSAPSPAAPAPAGATAGHAAVSAVPSPARGPGDATAAATAASPAPLTAGLPAPPPPPATSAPSAPPATPSPGGSSQAAAETLPPTPQSEAPQIYGVTNGPARVVLHAAADSWIEVRNADQSVLFTRVLKAGESYRVPDQPGMSMRTGNAGALDISVDGKPVPAIGPVGGVRRVALDPQALMAGTAVHQ